ncbi:hypothetical protein GLOIN_2v1791711 [Rhizophagus irregularis DAOM 181602=DAOM 197198]|nr:hypothetical protein GLOIN_2v1791711 [Rhizophagus irregularis DAOM 181602=DAOM 197198]
MHSNTSQRKSSYIEFLKEDLQNETINTFGLMEALQEPNFLKEFEKFSNSDSNEYWKFSMTRFFHFRFFSQRKFNVNFVTLPSSHLEKILSRFFFVVKAKIYRQLCFFSFRFFHVVPLLPFTSVFFTLLKPNFKTDPISKVPLLPFTSIHTDVIHPTMMIQQV